MKNKHYRIDIIGDGELIDIISSLQDIISQLEREPIESKRHYGVASLECEVEELER